jgi:hypothetical protein
MSVKLLQAALAERYHHLPVPVAQNLYCFHYYSLAIFAQTSQSDALPKIRLAITSPGACHQILLEV